MNSRGHLPSGIRAKLKAEERAKEFDSATSLAIRRTLGFTRISDATLSKLLADFRATLLFINTDSKITTSGHDLDMLPLDHFSADAVEKRVAARMLKEEPSSTAGDLPAPSL